MKGTIKYYLLIILSAACSVAPAAGIAVAFFTGTAAGTAAGCITAVAGLALFKPVRDMRVVARNEVEYDEFGFSRTKGKYEYLSKAERNQIDLQKTADMERVMDSSALKKMTRQGSADPDGDMEDLVGLAPVKQKMDEMVARMKFEQMENRGKKKSERKNSMSGRHMVFYGPPGTGKTSVARIITGFLYKYGYIRENKCVEVDGNFLKAGGNTALKTELVIRHAYGGVLFIDEAYSMMDAADGSGTEAVATIIKQMEDNRDRFILIMAGYTNEMSVLLRTNPGFESRIKEYVDFPDYGNGELETIFRIMARQQGFTVSDEACRMFAERIERERRSPSFGNARTVRNILDESMDRHALNYVNGTIPSTARHTLCGLDVSRELKRKTF